ncbi:unnamed protein product [Ectocarpus sp. 12 AP-2014]
MMVGTNLPVGVNVVTTEKNRSGLRSPRTPSVVRSEKRRNLQLIFQRQIWIHVSMYTQEDIKHQSYGVVNPSGIDSRQPKEAPQEGRWSKRFTPPGTIAFLLAAV